jgi:Fe-S cluster assembly protein SufD
MSTFIAEQNAYAAQFASLREQFTGSHLPWLERLREKGMDDFLALGFPTTKLENWKYTNVAPIRRIAFQPAFDAPVASLPAELNFRESPRVVFVNGRFNAELSTVRTLSISEGLRSPERASIIQKHLGRYTSTSDHAFAAWNTAFFADGAYLEIPRGMICEQPIHLVFVSAGNGEPWASHPRNLIVAGEGSQVTFVEWFIGSNDGVYLTNTLTEIAAGPAAVVDYYKIERESSRAFHVAVINAHLDRDASLTSHSISCGGSLVRNDLNIERALCCRWTEARGQPHAHRSSSSARIEPRVVQGSNRG